MLLSNKIIFHPTIDRGSIKKQRIRVTESEFEQAYKNISKDLLEGIKLARSKIEAFHRQRIP